MSKNLSFLSGRKGLRENLFEELGILSEPTGTVPIEKLDALRNEFLFGKANLYGTVSFYDFLKKENEGKKVFVCNGTACLCAGTQEKIREDLQSYFTKDQIGEMCCLGRCHENHAFHHNGLNYSGESSIDYLSSFLENNNQIFTDHYHIGRLGKSVLIEADESETFVRQVIQKIVTSDRDVLLEDIKTSGLRGRGGAGFPIGIKIEGCKNEKSDIKFIVCNADEGDPGAFSDRYLLEHKPYAVLLGMMMAGYIAGAQWGVLYIRAEYPESIAIIQKAVHNLYDLSLLGENIFESGFTFDFKIIKAQGAYICGEETALLSSIEGQRPEVRVRPPYPTQAGLFQKPTIVNNVETLANLPGILMHGGDVYQSLGIGKSKGTKLLCLDSFFNRPGLYEVEMGTPLSKVIYELGQGFKQNVKAIHIGGPLGGVVPASKFNDLTIDFESFQSQGFLLGHGSFVCIPESFSMIEYIKHLFQFTAHESCGKCFPCRLGSTRGYEMAEKAIEGTYKIDMALMNDLLETMQIGSLCALGGGLPLPIQNILYYFKDELSPYFQEN